MDEDGEKEDGDVLDVGDGIEGGEPMGDDVKLNDNEGGERLLVGDELVEEIAEEVEGSWTRRGRHSMGGGTCDSEHEASLRSVQGPGRVSRSVSAHFSHLL